MATVTHSPQGDRGDLERIYDTLRKRSLRQLRRTRCSSPHCPICKGRDGRQHAEYVRGVREALNTVKVTR